MVAIGLIASPMTPRPHCIQVSHPIIHQRSAAVFTVYSDVVRQ